MPDNDEDECFYDSRSRILSSASSSTSTSDDDNVSPNFRQNHHRYNRTTATPRLSNYDIWISQPSSVEERRSRLLREMGLCTDPSFSRPIDGSVSPVHVTGLADNLNGGDVMVRLKLDGTDSNYSSLLFSSMHSIVETGVTNQNSDVSPLAEPPMNDDSGGGNLENHLYCGDDQMCTIKNLDNGKEFVVKELREDGMWDKLKEIGTGRQLTMEEFEMSVGHSPIVHELMRRQCAGNNNKDDSISIVNENSYKSKKKGGWLKNIRSSVAGYKEIWSSDEKDTSSEKGGRRSSSATDDSQDLSFHGPERIRVRHFGKSSKDLSALYKNQEMQAHSGSIWSMRFSLDGRYLASAGEDCVIHVWQVGESERRGDLLMEKVDDGILNMLLASPEPNSLSPNHAEKKKKGKTSLGRKSLSSDHVVVPETVFALSEKPFCSFRGHLEDVLDLSWSKSQLLLSSSMDKTVRLWQLTTLSCLKVFSHNDYVTCIQFNPMNDDYFISGSLDGKVRIWSIPDRHVVDWSDMHDMITAACFTPDGHGALVGSCKGSCHLYNTSDNKLQHKTQIKLQKKKKSQQKKITGFQFAPGSSSEVLVTSADSRVRVIDGTDLVHKFKGFRNTNSQISASLTSNGRYVVCASEDSYVYVWKYSRESRPSRTKGGLTVSRSYEHFHCQDVSVAIPWPGLREDDPLSDSTARSPESLLLTNPVPDEPLTGNHPPTPAEAAINRFYGTISSANNSYFFDRFSATWPEEKLVLRNWSPFDSSGGGLPQNRSAWGMVIVTAGVRGEIKTFQNFGLPFRI